MKVSPEKLKQQVDRFKEGIRQSGAKLTHQRLEIFCEVARYSNHPNVDMIYKGVRKRVSTVSLDTVYRTLWLLLDLGLITTFGPTRKKTRFDANMRPHHHFVCSRCGMIHDFYSKKFNQLKIPDSINMPGSIEKTQVEAIGLCLQCSKKKINLNKTT